jgi:uncharacterized repeat protein (TIGR03803 family)
MERVSVFLQCYFSKQKFMRKHLLCASFALVICKIAAQTLIATNGHGQLVRFNADSTGHQVLHQFGDFVPSAAIGLPINCGLSYDGAQLYGFTRGNFTTGVGGAIISTPTGTTDAPYAGPPTVLFNFRMSAAQGRLPQGRPLLVGDKLFGIAQFGGTQDRGTLFSIKNDGTEFTVLHHFKGGATDGREPMASLILASDGYLYGTTTKGGADNKGVVYKLMPDGSNFTIIKSFVGSLTDAQNPEHPLFESILDNRLYGLTSTGGQFGNGTLYRLAPTGDFFEVVHHFEGSEGKEPAGELVQDEFGLYGVTRSSLQNGGPAEGGVFEYALGTGMFKQVFKLVFSPATLRYAKTCYGIQFNVVNSSVKNAVLTTDGGYVILNKGVISGEFDQVGLAFGSYDGPNGLSAGISQQKALFANNRFYAMGEQGGLNQFGSGGCIYSVKTEAEYFQFMYRFDTAFVRESRELSIPIQASNGQVYVSYQAAGIGTDYNAFYSLGSVHPDGSNFKQRTDNFRASRGYLRELANGQIAGTAIRNNLEWSVCEKDGSGLLNASLDQLPNTPVGQPFYQSPTDFKIYMLPRQAPSIINFQPNGTLQTYNGLLPAPSGGGQYPFCADFDAVNQNFVGFQSLENFAFVWQAFKDGMDYQEVALPAFELLEPLSCALHSDGYVYGITKGTSNPSSSNQDIYGRIFRVKPDGTGYSILFSLYASNLYRSTSPTLKVAPNGRIFFTCVRLINGAAIEHVASIANDGSDFKIAAECPNLLGLSTAINFNFFDPTIPVVSDPVSAAEPQINTAIPLKIMPNPTQNGRTALVFNLPADMDVAHFSVCDMQGRVVSAFSKKEIMAGLQQIELILDQQPTGLYFLKMETQWSRSVVKFIHQQN